MKLNKIIIAIILPILFIFFLINIKILFINSYAYQAEKALAYNNLDSAFNYFEKTLGANDSTLSPYTRYRYASVILSYALNNKYLGQESNPEILKRGIELQIENSKKEWPYFTRNYLVAGQLSNYLGDYEQAKKYFNQALELSPNRPELFLELANTYMLIKNYDSAEKQIKKALAYDQNSPLSNWQLLLLRIRQNKNQEASKMINKLHSIKYNILNFKSFNELAWAYEDAGNTEKAQVYYRVLAKLWPKIYSSPSTL